MFVAMCVCLLACGGGEACVGGVELNLYDAGP